MRTVLHCDMNNYFASVETVDYPGLAGVPMAVCGDPVKRHGIVLAKNELAKMYGVTTGEPMNSAVRKCPGLVTVPPHYQKYQAYSKMARSIFSRYSGQVYPFGMDEAWIVLPEGTSQKAGAFVADELRNTIKRELRITASVGVSYNFVFSKLASDMKKPDATIHLPPQSLEDIIWKLPVSDLLFVGKVTNRTLGQLGIRTIGDIARQDRAFMRRVLGKNGEMLWCFANGDDSSFDPSAERDFEAKSIGNSVTPARDICTHTDASAFLWVLSGAVSERIRRYGLKAGCVSINVRTEDFLKYSRQCTLRRPTDDRCVIFSFAEELLRFNHKWNKGIRSIGVRLDRLVGTDGEQLPLFPDEYPVPEIAETAVGIYKRYGNAVIEREEA